MKTWFTITVRDNVGVPDPDACFWASRIRIRGIAPAPNPNWKFVYFIETLVNIRISDSANSLDPVPKTKTCRRTLPTCGTRIRCQCRSLCRLSPASAPAPAGSGRCPYRTGSGSCTKNKSSSQKGSPAPLKELVNGTSFQKDPSISENMAVWLWTVNQAGERVEVHRWKYKMNTLYFIGSKQHHACFWYRKKTSILFCLFLISALIDHWTQRDNNNNGRQQKVLQLLLWYHRKRWTVRPKCTVRISLWTLLKGGRGLSMCICVTVGVKFTLFPTRSKSGINHPIKWEEHICHVLCLYTVAQHQSRLYFRLANHTSREWCKLTCEARLSSIVPVWGTVRRRTLLTALPLKKNL